VRPQDPGHSGDREAHLFGNLAVFKPCAPNSFTFPRTVITFVNYALRMRFKTGLKIVAAITPWIPERSLCWMGYALALDHFRGLLKPAPGGVPHRRS